MPVGVYKRTKEHCLHISLARKGIKKTEEHKKKISKSMKGKQIWLGKVHSEETKKKMSNALRGENHYNWKGGITNYKRKLYLNNIRRSLRNNAKGNHNQEEWLALLVICNFSCVRCDRREPEIVLTEDHIIPLSKGGSNYIWNIQPLCRSCNSIKKTKIIYYVKAPPGN